MCDVASHNKSLAASLLTHREPEDDERGRASEEPEGLMHKPVRNMPMTLQLAQHVTGKSDKVLHNSPERAPLVPDLSQGAQHGDWQRASEGQIDILQYFLCPGVFSVRVLFVFCWVCSCLYTLFPGLFVFFVSAAHFFVA